MADDALLPASNMISREEGETLRCAGAKLHARVIAVPSESLRGRELIAVTGGRGKVEAVAPSCAAGC